MPMTYPVNPSSVRRKRTNCLNLSTRAAPPTSLLCPSKAKQTPKYQPNQKQHMTAPATPAAAPPRRGRRPAPPPPRPRTGVGRAARERLPRERPPQLGVREPHDRLRGGDEREREHRPAEQEPHDREPRAAVPLEKSLAGP